MKKEKNPDVSSPLNVTNTLSPSPSSSTLPHSYPHPLCLFFQSTKFRNYALPPIPLPLPLPFPLPSHRSLSPSLPHSLHHSLSPSLTTILPPLPSPPSLPSPPPPPPPPSTLTYPHLPRLPSFKPLYFCEIFCDVYIRW